MSRLDIDALQRVLQRFADERDWEQFHAPKNLACALSVEAAELLEVFQWLSETQSRGNRSGTSAPRTRRRRDRRRPDLSPAARGQGGRRSRRRGSGARLPATRRSTRRRRPGATRRSTTGCRGRRAPARRRIRRHRHGFPAASDGPDAGLDTLGEDPRRTCCGARAGRPPPHSLPRRWWSPPRTICRDIAALMAMRVPIDGTAGVDGYPRFAPHDWSVALGECRTIMRRRTVVREVLLRSDNPPVPHLKEGQPRTRRYRRRRSPSPSPRHRRTRRFAGPSNARHPDSSR